MSDFNETIFATCPACGRHDAFRRYDAGGGSCGKDSWSHLICDSCQEGWIVEEKVDSRVHSKIIK